MCYLFQKWDFYFILLKTHFVGFCPSDLVGFETTLKCQIIVLPLNSNPSQTYIILVISVLCLHPNHCRKQSHSSLFWGDGAQDCTHTNVSIRVWWRRWTSNLLSEVSYILGSFNNSPPYPDAAKGSRPSYPLVSLPGLQGSCREWQFLKTVVPFSLFSTQNWIEN